LADFLEIFFLLNKFVTSIKNPRLHQKFKAYFRNSGNTSEIRGEHYKFKWCIGNSSDASEFSGLNRVRKAAIWNSSLLSKKFNPSIRDSTLSSGTEVFHQKFKGFIRYSRLTTAPDA
jgi:hypothetical protein